LRVARGIGKDETQASLEVFQTLKRRGHPDAPPPTLSDGWGGIDQAMIEVYGQVPPRCGRRRGRPPTRKRAGSDWQYVQMVKQRNEQGRVEGVEIRVIFGDKAAVTTLLGQSTAYIERSHLTSRLFNSRQSRKTLAFSKSTAMNRAAATWEDSYYNLVRPHKSLRLRLTNDPKRHWLPRTPAMAAQRTDHIWTVKELLTTLPLPIPNNTS
jgi:hypothetical protein